MPTSLAHQPVGVKCVSLFSLVPPNSERLSGGVWNRDKCLNTLRLRNLEGVRKEHIKHIRDYKYPGAAWNYFVAWYRTPLHSIVEHLIRLARMLRDYWEGIAAHYRYPIHTPVLEGI